MKIKASRKHLLPALSPTRPLRGDYNLISLVRSRLLFDQPSNRVVSGMNSTFANIVIRSIASISISIVPFIRHEGVDNPREISGDLGSGARVGEQRSAEQLDMNQR